jgi:radical SAM protein with 4Fe4S-binding SPASM domain
LLGSDIAKTGPAYVDIDLTNRCNLRCLGCPYHSPHVKTDKVPKPAKSDLSINLFKDLCRDLKTVNTRQFIFQGSGEPLLHPEIFEFIKTAKSSGFHVTLLTNGTLIDKEMARMLVKSRVDIIKVSLWASSSAQYELNYPGSPSGNFEKVLDGLTYLKEFKSRLNVPNQQVILYHIVNAQNLHSIEKMIELGSERECDGIYFSPMQNVKSQLNSFALSEDEMKIFVRRLLGMKKRLALTGLEHNIGWVVERYRMGDAVWEKMPCYIAWYHARIRVDGSVQSCGRCDHRVSFGNLNTETFPDIWNSYAIRKFRHQTFTREGLASLCDRCDCRQCCFVVDNLRVHRIFRWFRPISKFNRRMKSKIFE